MEKKPVSRRDFIKGAGMAVGASVLAACTTPTPATVEVIQTQVVTQENTVVVKQTVQSVVTATPMPTQPPAPAVMDIWFNGNIDLTKEWKNDPNDATFKAEWYWGGLARALFTPWLAKNPGVSMKITTHSWDSDLRQNQLMALAAGLIPDTTYGEAYVNEFVQLGVYRELSADVASSQTAPMLEPVWAARSTAYPSPRVQMCSLSTWINGKQPASIPPSCPPPGKI